jgi:bacilliredoxin
MFETYRPSGPMYDEEMIRPMREELTSAGFEELRTVEEVDRALRDGAGLALVMVNSVCGCAAGSARPGVVRALGHRVVPDRLLTVFAGQDREATAHVRELLSDYPPSSPSIALFKDGRPVFMLERRQIEGRMPEEIATQLEAVFDRFCSKSGETVGTAERQ